MRPRAGREPAAVPEPLVRFVAAEWRVGDPWEAWKAARRAWVAEHGEETYLGDRLDLLRGEVATKLAP